MAIQRSFFIDMFGRTLGPAKLLFTAEAVEYRVETRLRKPFARAGIALGQSYRYGIGKLNRLWSHAARSGQELYATFEGFLQSVCEGRIALPVWHHLARI